MYQESWQIEVWSFAFSTICSFVSFRFVVMSMCMCVRNLKSGPIIFHETPWLFKCRKYITQLNLDSILWNELIRVEMKKWTNERTEKKKLKVLSHPRIWHFRIFYVKIINALCLWFFVLCMYYKIWFLYQFCAENESHMFDARFDLLVNRHFYTLIYSFIACCCNRTHQAHQTEYNRKYTHRKKDSKLKQCPWNSRFLSCYFASLCFSLLLLTFVVPVIHMHRGAL